MSSTHITGLPDNPPPFDWGAWYEAAGGRTLDIPEIDVFIECIDAGIGAFCDQCKACRIHYCAACLPTCVYNHKAWARDFDTFSQTRYPTVAFDEPPEPIDSVPEDLQHTCPRLFRATPLAPWKDKARKRRIESTNPET